MQAAKKAGDVAEAQKQDGLQQNYKILINSVYGYVGSKYSRLYDKDNAIAVTLTGQRLQREFEGKMHKNMRVLDYKKRHEGWVFEKRPDLQEGFCNFSLTTIQINQDIYQR